MYTISLTVDISELYTALFSVTRPDQLIMTSEELHFQNTILKFSMPLKLYMKLYSPNHGNSKDRETDIYKESKHKICYSKVLTRCLTTTF